MMMIIMIMVMLMLMAWRRRKEEDVCIFPRVAVGEDALLGILDVCIVSTFIYMCVRKRSSLVARRRYHTQYYKHIAHTYMCI